MLKSEIGMQDNNHHSVSLKGFTLVEILVVLVIIAISVSFALMAFGDFGADRKIRAAAEEFSQVVTLLHERALLESRTFRLVLTTKDYTVQCLNAANQWQNVSLNVQQHVLPAKTVITVTYGSSKSEQLRIVFSSTGDMTPFKVYFGSPSQLHLASVTGEDNGQVNYQKESHK